jgi:hypothetical protein
MKLTKLLSRSYFALLLMVLFAAPAFAYLDPGTLSYVISMIAGLFIAAGAAIAIFRRKIKLFFQNLGKKKQDEAAEAVAEAVEDTVDPLADVAEDAVDPLADAVEETAETAAETVESAVEDIQ